MLTHSNYNEWKDDLILILGAMRGDAIVTERDPELPQLDFNQDDNYDDWKAREAEPWSMIRLSCSPNVQHIINGR